MNIRLHLQIVGVLILILSAAHVLFNRYFGWKKELAHVSLLTRQVFFVHCFFIALLLALLGAGSLFYADELLRPNPLSRAVLTGMLIFWSFRLIFQWFVYDQRTWRGNRFYTFMHVCFSLLWIYVVVTYSAAVRIVSR